MFLEKVLSECQRDRLGIELSRIAHSVEVRTDLHGFFICHCILRSSNFTPKSAQICNKNKLTKCNVCVLIATVYKNFGLDAFELGEPS